jgi:hypothetical protein
VIRIGVKNLGWRTVEAIVVAICPESGSVGVWLCDSKECESSHGKGKLCSEQVEYGLS